MRVEELLQRFTKVKPRGNNNWMACCPAHSDKTSSLSIKAVDDRILIYCFGQQCAIGDILGAVGLKVSDIMPESFKGHSKGAKPKMWAMDGMKLLKTDIRIIALAGYDMKRGKVLTPSEVDRVGKASKHCFEVFDSI